MANAGNVEGLPPFAMWPVGGEAGYTYYTGIEGWMYYVVAWASIGLGGTVAAQDFWERVLAAKNEKTAVRTCWITSGIYLVFGMMCALIGIAAWEINPTFTGEALEQIFPWMATTLLSPHLAIFVCVALVAALMSSGDSANNLLVNVYGLCNHTCCSICSHYFGDLLEEIQQLRLLELYNLSHCFRGCAYHSLYSSIWN